jgi:hypothetical protein
MFHVLRLGLFGGRLQAELASLRRQAAEQRAVLQDLQVRIREVHFCLLFLQPNRLSMHLLVKGS